MGAVFQALDTQGDRRVAVKVMRSATTASPELAARFEREARLLAGLRHPHIVEYIDYGRTGDGALYLVTALIPGLTLQAFLAKRGKLEVGEAAALLAPLAAALDVVHAAGIVHRDLKPSNVLLDKQQRPYLADFGVARELTADLTRTGATVGTLAYMAPEQLVNAKAVTGAADVYALGIIAYELLTGRLPFTGTDAELVDDHRFHAPRPPEEWNPAISTAVSSVVLRALVKDPTGRFSPASAMADALRLAVDHDFITVLPESVHFPLHLHAPPNNLPAPEASLLGRESDRGRIAAMLRDGTARLVTLTGPGGVGKTQLSLDVARMVLPAYEDGVFFVPLAPLAHGALVLPELAAILGVREGQGQTLEEAVHGWLRPKRLLLVIDNCEHLPDVAALLSRLLQAVPGLTILATSREPLYLRAEREYPLDVLAQADAVTLFVRRAQAIRPTFRPGEEIETIATICERVDRLPLAIELAAAATRLYAPKALLAGLDDRLRLIRSRSPDRPDRQQTLEASIDWSYQLLAPDERALFRRLGVFAGGRTLEAVEAICVTEEMPPNIAYDLVESLVAKSLLLPSTAEDPPRLLMLQTIGAFALEKLRATGESERFRRRHAGYYVRFAQACDPTAGGREQPELLATLQAEHDNFRAALSWAIEDGDAPLALALLEALHAFWITRGHFAEAREWHERARPLALSLDAAQQSHLLCLAGYVALATSDPAAGALFAEALEPAERSNNAAAIADVRRGLGEAALKEHRFDEAGAAFAEALALREGEADARGVAEIWQSQARLARYQGQFDDAERLHRQSIQAFEALGDRVNIARDVTSMGVIMRDQGRYDEARRLYERGLRLHEELGNVQGVAAGYNNLGELALITGDPERAGGLIDQTIAIYRELGDLTYLAYALLNRGTVAQEIGAHGEARAFYEESLQKLRRLDDRWGVAAATGNLGGIALHAGELEQAARLMRAGLALFATLDYRHELANSLYDFANGLYLFGRRALALKLYGALLCRNDGMKIAVTPSAEALFEQNVAHARASLDAAQVDALWQAGEALGLNEAVELALAETVDLAPEETPSG